MTYIEIFKNFKKKYPSIWSFIEILNGALLRLFFRKSLKNIEQKIIDFLKKENISANYASIRNVISVSKFLNELPSEDILYFHPFDYSKKSLSHVLSCHTYQIYVVYFDNQIVGLFFLRYFINNKCFLGYVVKKEFRGKGLGKKMLQAIIYGVSNSGFALMSTICADNIASIKAHLATGKFEIIEKLSSNEIVLKMKEENKSIKVY